MLEYCIAATSMMSPETVLSPLGDILPRGDDALQGIPAGFGNSPLYKGYGAPPMRLGVRSTDTFWSWPAKGLGIGIPGPLEGKQEGDSISAVAVAVAMPGSRAFDWGPVLRPCSGPAEVTPPLGLSCRCKGC